MVARDRRTKDWPVIEECAHRGRVAPEGPLHGDRRGYDLADGGFFRAATAADPCGWTWHNYALCRWLAYGDMKGAERAFVRSVQCAPHDRLIQENFDFFLDKAYPNKRDAISCYDVIRQDATRQMVRELENEEKRRERQRNDPRVQAATMRIQIRAVRGGGRARGRGQGRRPPRDPAPELGGDALHGHGPDDVGHRRGLLRARQGSKRVRNSQLQRLLSRPFSTRFG